MPNSPFANGHKQLMSKVTNDARAARELKYKALRGEMVQRGRKVMVKSKEEEKQEMMDEAKVEKIIKQQTFEKAKLVFYGGVTERNPWHENIANTMFWM